MLILTNFRAPIQTVAGRYRILHTPAVDTALSVKDQARESPHDISEHHSVRLNHVGYFLQGTLVIPRGALQN
jgi:hypothetical protein